MKQQVQEERKQHVQDELEQHVEERREKCKRGRLAKKKINYMNGKCYKFQKSNLVQSLFL